MVRMEKVLIALLGAPHSLIHQKGDKMGKWGSKVVENVQPKVGGESRVIAAGESAAPMKIGPPKMVQNDSACGGASTSARAAAGAARQE